MITNDRNVKNFPSLMRSFNHVPVITEPTRYPPASFNQQPALFDRMWFPLCNKELVTSGILLYDGTDHCPTFITLSIPKHYDVKKKIKLVFRDTNPNNKKNLVDMIKAEDWDSIVHRTANPKLFKK